MNMASTKSPVIQLRYVRKVFGGKNNSLVALNDITVNFEKGSFTAIMGPSGSGKSTLLHCAAGLDTPTSGSVQFEATEISGLSETALTKLRRERIGFVFQSFNLMPALTVTQNITLPLRLAHRKIDTATIGTIIERVGLGERRNHLPSELSGGQQQRVAIARALAMQPAVIFGDEPTGALDTRTSLEILALLTEAVALGQTVIMVTHDPVAAAHADRILFLADGKIVEEAHHLTADQVADKMTQLGAWGEAQQKIVSLKS